MFFLIAFAVFGIALSGRPSAQKYLRSTRLEPADASRVPAEAPAGRTCPSAGKASEVTTECPSYDFTWVEERKEPQDAKSNKSSDKKAMESAGRKFEEHWAELVAAVKLDDLQEECKPTLTLEGPTNSNKLAILLHGFISCPGTWSFPTAGGVPGLAPLLEEHGFRVLLPVLPGHGRLWCTKDEDPESSRSGSQKKVYIDDLKCLPSSIEPYLLFANPIGMLAETFRQKHPKGQAQIVLVGFSLGGLLATRIAMERPETFDHVLIMNPAFGTGMLVEKVVGVAQMLNEKHKMPISDCEPMRQTGAEATMADTKAKAETKTEAVAQTGAKKKPVWHGGYCQFLVENINVVQTIGNHVFCEEWGLRTSCPAPGVVQPGLQERFKKLKSFQMVTTQNDGAVNNHRVLEFMAEMQEVHEEQRKTAMDEKRRQAGNQQDVAHAKKGDRVAKSAFCLWPEDFGHGYLGVDFWWVPYVRKVQGEYLLQGIFIDSFQHKDEDAAWCLPPSNDQNWVRGSALTGLPATQHSVSYVIAKKDSGYKSATVLFQGMVDKQTFVWKEWKRRMVEILEVVNVKNTSQSGENVPANGVPDKLLVTRKGGSNEKVRDIFLVGAVTVEEDGRCLRVQYAKVESGPFLLESVAQVRNAGFDNEGKSPELRFRSAHRISNMVDTFGNFCRKLCSHCNCSPR